MGNWEAVKWSDSHHIQLNGPFLSSLIYHQLSSCCRDRWCHLFYQICMYQTRWQEIVIKARYETSQRRRLALKYHSHQMQFDWNRQLGRHFKLMLLTTECAKLNWYCPNIFLDCVLFMFAFEPAPLTHCPCYYGAIPLPCVRHMLPSNSH